MSRLIKDIKDKNTGNLVYPKTHIKAVVVNGDTTLEDLLSTGVSDRLDTLESNVTTLQDEKLDKVEAKATYQPVGDYLVPDDLQPYATEEFVLEAVSPKLEDADSDGKVYGRQNSQWTEIQKIYSELEIPKERFEELLYRHYIVPTLLSAPTENTLQWADGNYTVNFEIGDYCRVEDTESDLGYKFYRLFNIDSEGKAIWSDIADPGDIVGETAFITLSSNQSNASSALLGATITVTDTTAGGLLWSGTWDGNQVEVKKITAGHAYTVSVSAINGHKTPESVTYTAIEGASRNIDMKYEACMITVNLVTNQSDHSDVQNAIITINNQQFSSGDSIPYAVGMQLSISVSAVTGYTTPDSKTLIAEGQSQTITMTYNTTIVTVNMADNQSSLDDIASATATVAAPGISNTTVRNGGSVKVPTGVSCTITWSSVTNYATPASQTFTTQGQSMSKTGTYNTELVTVNIAGSGGTPSGYTITIKNGTSVISTQTSNGVQHKIPYGVTYTITASAVDGFNTPSAITHKAEQVSRTITMTYIYNPYVDLSMQDIYGTTQAQTTANCYVVKAAGKYKFPCVYGNAINKGATNATAYKNNGGSNSHNFVNYKGNQINSPYIATDTSETISSAQLTIADTNNIFTNVAIEGSGANTYVTFEVASVPNTGANGIISIKNSSGTIMWNWHIWVWKDSLATVAITNSSSKTYNILPVNLASKWVNSSSSPTQITNWYYQFGRPTPLTPANTYNSTTNATTYGVLSFTTASIASTLNLGIQNPTTFYKYSSSYNYNWFSTNSAKTYNLWDQACTSTGCSDNSVVKTVYDPCPPGFKMPNGNTFTGFSTSNVVGSFTNGYKFKKNSSDTTGVFFPASGSRYGSDGSLFNVGSYGRVWSAAAYDQDYAYNLYFGSGYVDPQGGNRRAIGFSVRPVAES